MRQEKRRPLTICQWSGGILCVVENTPLLNHNDTKEDRKKRFLMLGTKRGISEL